MPQKNSRADIPKNAIRLNQLTTRQGEKAPSSGHVVTKVNFRTTSGLQGLGFLKKCDKTYPPVLAKMVVGLSQLYRSSLGQRASEERLVYDINYKIYGTVSIALKNFVPMQSTSDSNSNDPKKNELSNPETRILIDEEIAELLVASWRHKEDDLHPGNLSIAGRLDYDMSWYGFTSIIKGQRIVCGTLQSSPALGTTLREADLHEFPVLKSTRTHWPSQSPGNYNYSKSYKSQKSFYDLKDCDKFRNQMFTAILKELLSFQIKTVKARFISQLGNEVINLDSLKERPDSLINEKKDQLLALINQDVFYKDSKATEERTFVDFFTRISENEFADFYKCVVHYKEFRNFLIAHPEAYNEVRDFFVEDNKKHSIDEQINLDLLDENYHKIWRDVSLKTVIYSLKQLSDQFDQIKQDISLNTFFTDTDIETQHEIFKNESSAHDSDSDSEYFSHIPNINSQELQVDNNTQLKQIRNCIATLHSTLSTYCRNYFEEPQANLENNTTFIKNCTSQLDHAKQTIYKILNSSQSTSTKVNKHRGCEEVISNWKTMLSQLDYQEHVTEREELKDQPRIRYVAQKISNAEVETTQLLDNDINKVLTDALADWLSQQKLADLIVHINVALNEYAPKVSHGILSFVNMFAYTRRREPTVRKLLNDVIKESTMDSTKLVSIIFSEKDSTWKEQSLNSIVMKRLLNQMLKDYTSNFDSGSHYSSLAKFKDVKAHSNFNFHKHILKVKDHFIEYTKSYEANMSTVSTAPCK